MNGVDDDMSRLSTSGVSTEAIAALNEEEPASLRGRMEKTALALVLDNSPWAAASWAAASSCLTSTCLSW